MEKKTKSMIAAAFGGAAPTLIRSFIQATHGISPFPSLGFFIWYSFGLMGFSFVGFLTAYFVNETDSRKAIVLGIGLPAMFQVGVGDLSQIQAKSDPAPLTEKVSWSPFVAIANASELKIPNVEERQRNLDIDVEGSRTPDAVSFYSKDKKIIQELSLESTSDGRASVEIPAGTKSVAVIYKGVTSRKLDVGAIDEDSSAVSVKIIDRPWTGFLEAIGYQNAPRYEITVSAPSSSK